MGTEYYREGNGKCIGQVNNEGGTSRFESYRRCRAKSHSSTEKTDSSLPMKRGVENLEYWSSGMWVVRVIAMMKEAEIGGIDERLVLAD